MNENKILKQNKTKTGETDVCPLGTTHLGDCFPHSPEKMERKRKEAGAHHTSDSGSPAYPGSGQQHHGICPVFYSGDLLLPSFWMGFAILMKEPVSNS